MIHWYFMKDVPKDGTQILVARNNDFCWEYDIVYYDSSFGDQYPWRRVADSDNGYAIGQLDFWTELNPPYELPS